MDNCEKELEACEDDLQYYKTQNGRLRKRVSELEKSTMDKDPLYQSFRIILIFGILFWIVFDILNTIRSW